uniref:Uncharacterized protein n=1 Tax=Arundo donax TaxID=35708 RepID=A0A0A8Y505_ARUDO
MHCPQHALVDLPHWRYHTCRFQLHRRIPAELVLHPVQQQNPPWAHEPPPVLKPQRAMVGGLPPSPPRQHWVHETLACHLRWQDWIHRTGRVGAGWALAAPRRWAAWAGRRDRRRRRRPGARISCAS